MDSNHDFSHFTIAVIGLGLMGGSFAKRFKAIGSRVIGINRTASVAQEALRMGIVDSISEEDLKDADIVIFCTPEKGTMAFIEKKIGLLKKDAVLTDIAGVKNDSPKNFRKSSLKGWISSADIRCADMKGRDSRSQTGYFPRCELRHHPAGGKQRSHITLIEEMARALGCRHVPKVTADAHDRAIAYTSDLSMSSRRRSSKASPIIKRRSISWAALSVMRRAWRISTAVCGHRFSVEPREAAG
mgnify:CR=1 FL=1